MSRINMFNNFSESVSNIKLDIVSFEGGEGVTALYVNKELYKYGDYYHDKISYIIDGIIEGLKLANVEHIVKRYECIDDSVNTILFVLLCNGIT